MRWTTSRRFRYRAIGSLGMRLLALGCAVLFLGCAGGSGSSGFDPVAAENAAIQQAIESQNCQVIDGLTICASGAAPAPTSTATATPPAPSATRTVRPTSTPTAGHVTFTPSPTESPLPTALLTATATFPSQPTPTGTPILIGTTTPTRTPGPFESPTPTGTQLPATPTPTLPLPTTTQTLPPATATRVAPPTTTAVPSETPTATEIPTPAQPSVDTNIPPDATQILCQRPTIGAPCVFVLTFQPHGLPASAAYRVAVRRTNPNSNWDILPTVDHSAAIEVDPGRDYQIGVLVFLSDPGTLPEQVELLSDTGADLAFVTPSVTALQLVVATFGPTGDEP